jgi:hypothetical protein
VFWNAFDHEWLDLVPTTGGFTRHPQAIQAELLDCLGAAVDAAGGTFTMSYVTIAATAARLLPGEPVSRRV